MRLPERLLSISWRDLAIAVGPVVLLTVLVTWATYHLVRPAPPDTITITTGTEGSMFRTSAERYKRILARNGVALQILPSEGSWQNLQRLNDSSVNVALGFIQGGLATVGQAEKLVSLGSVFRESLAIFYRSATPVTVLSEFGGQRLAIGMQGSGGRGLALVLLKANGIEPGGATQLLDQTGNDAADSLIERRVDAVFLAGDSASFPVMRKLRSTPGIRLFNFMQADAYTRRFPYLDKLELPMGIFDLGKNSPPETVFLIGPTVELVAREGLHPALSDLLIEAAREVHGGAGLMRRAGEFPAPLERE